MIKRNFLKPFLEPFDLRALSVKETEKLEKERDKHSILITMVEIRVGGAREMIARVVIPMKDVRILAPDGTDGRGVIEVTFDFIPVAAGSSVRACARVFETALGVPASTTRPGDDLNRGCRVLEPTGDL